MTTIEDKVANSQAVAVRTKAEEVREYVTTTLAPQIDDLLARQIGKERFMRVILNAFRATPKLMECSKASLGAALMNAAALQLEPNTPLGHAYLIPYKDQCQLIIGYQGLVDLARRSGEVAEIMAHVVREGDEFTYTYGMNADLRHKPSEVRGRITHVYAYARLTKGGFPFVVMSAAEVEDLKNRGAAGRGVKTPWDTDEEMMYCKTAVRRLTKYLPKTLELATALEVDAEPEQADEVEA